MALSTTRPSSPQQPTSTAAAVVARPLSSGRGMASVRSEIESLNLSNHVDLGSHPFLYYEQDQGQGSPFFDRKNQSWQGTPYIFRAISGFSVTALEALAEQNPASDGGERPLFARYLNGIRTYEASERLTTMAKRQPGQTLNILN